MQKYKLYYSETYDCYLITGIARSKYVYASSLKEFKIKPNFENIYKTKLAEYKRNKSVANYFGYNGIEQLINKTDFALINQNKHPLTKIFL